MAWVAGAAAASANAALLVVFRTGGVAAGSYGAGAVPFLFAHFVACGALSGVAAWSAVRRTPLAAAVIPVTTVAAGAGLIGSFRVWAYGPNPGPFLGALLAWAAVPALLWALAASSRQRPAAMLVAVTMTVLWLVGTAFEGRF